jgi:hypothetical protein
MQMQNSEAEMIHEPGRTARWRVVAAFCILNAALLLSLGCSARVKADSVPDGPPLAVPIAPAHEVAVEQIAEAPPPEPPPAPEPAPPAARPAASRPPARPAEPRVETPPPTQPAAAVTQPKPDAPAVRATPPAAGAAAEERKVRQLLTNASESLKKVPYEKLSDEGRAQYEQSKRFSDEALQAIKASNFVYALTLAEKAATLAAELVR